MESIGGRTESQIETICRSIRRVKNNSKNIARKVNESKYQDNVDKCSLVQSKVDTNVKDEEGSINTSLNARLSGTAANINSSTPRRKKDPLANLHSNLSPKYIGYTTPPNQLNSSNEETTRSLRRRHNNSNNTPEDKEKDIGITFTPNSESTVGFVRRTPRSRDSPNTSDKCAKRKDFVSPIDKLLRKNGSVMENNNLPLAGNINSSLNDNVVMNSKNYNEEEIMDLGIKVLEIFDVKTEENKENVSISEENYDEINENNEDEIEFISISSELADEIDDEDEDNDEELENDKVFKSNDHEDITQNNSDISENESSEDDDETFTQPDENVEDFHETCLTHELCEAQVTIKPTETFIISLSNDTAEDYSEEKESLMSEDKTFVQESSDDKKETLEIFLPNNESVKSTELNKATLAKAKIESTQHESNQLNAQDTSPANSPSAVSMDSAKGSSITNERSWMPFSTGDLYWGQIYNYCYWPCIVCPDPDGKTITTEEISRSGVQKVLVHVRFFADNGRRNWVRRDNLMPYNGIESYQEQIIEVGKKYGTKSAKYKLYVPNKRKEPVWQEAVKEANIVAEVPYPKRMEKFYEIFEKSRAFLQLEKQRRKSIYISVNSGTGSDIESFYGSNDNVSNLSIAATAMFRQKRERSISPYSPVYSPIKSVSSKRRKLSDQGLSNTASSSEVLDAAFKSEENTTCTDLYLSQNNSIASSSSNSNSLNDMEMFNGLEYKKFYAVMKDYVMEENHNEKLEKSLVVAVRNIWALKQLGRQQMERKLRESLIENDISSILALENDYATGVGDVSVKRLSSRLKTLKVRKSLIAQQQLYESFRERSVTPKSKTKGSSSVEKVKKQLNRPILEVIDDIFELNTKYLFKGMSRDPVCKYCLKPGGNLKRCANNCTSWLHNECLYKDFSQKIRRGNKSLNTSTKNKNNNGTLNGSNSSSIVSLSEVGAVSHVTGDFEIQDTNNVVCKECANNEPTKCMVCNYTESKKENDPLVKCCMAQCERAFHPTCCKYWPQSKFTISKSHIESFRCPSHVCHTCVSDDPKGKFQHLSNAKLTKCVKCPATFHTDSTCIPAGSQILTAAHIICPRHASTKHDMTVNVNWCFICVKGGQVMCCETCPTAVHVHCLNLPIDANECYICEECESGRMPLYGEMVWAKFNTFRWWPAIILPPTEVPMNIAQKSHNPSDFVVRFFGTHDHGWISRRRVYLYVEGDSSEPPKSKSKSLDLNYTKGVAEAKEVYEIIKAKKLSQISFNENKEKLHPQPYVRIKANRVVPPVKLHVDMESVSKCECDPREENPCGADTNCLNRVLYHECNPKLCPAGERCQNQMFESRISPRLDVVYMTERGFGLVCREPIKAGTFIIEYVGEVINDNEFQARLQQKSHDRDENFYFLSVEKDYIIDAGPKGNLARFMNHSCDPNCETQKWNVNSLNRVGLFAIKDIPENTELTFNYHWDDLLGNEKKTCYCGSKNCAGQIGGKIKDLETFKEPAVADRVEKINRKVNANRRTLNNKGLKKKLGLKLLKTKKTKTITKKMVPVTNGINSARRKANKNDTLTATNASKSTETTDKEASTSRLLESPDIFL